MAAFTMAVAGASRRECRVIGGSGAALAPARLHRLSQTPGRRGFTSLASLHRQPTVGATAWLDRRPGYFDGGQPMIRLNVVENTNGFS